MSFDLFLIIVALVWLVAASLFDIYTREVPDWLNFSLVAIGLGSRAIYSVNTWDIWPLLYGLIGFGIFFGLGFILYYAKQWGGGDSKLLMGLGAMFGSAPLVFNANFDWPFLLILIMNILVAGAVYGIIYGLVLAVKNWKVVKKKLVKENKLILYLTSGLGVLAIITSFFMDSLFLLMFLFGVLIIVAGALIFLMKIVDAYCLFKTKKVKDLVEGDWVVKDLKSKGSLIYKVRRLGLKAEDILKIQKSSLRLVKIKEGIPFVPAFLIGFVLSVVLGNFIFVI
jgi:Flp pilus assembly protein protease CpaA